MLILYIRHGVKVEKVHKIISFKQSNWLEKYKSFNTQKQNKLNLNLKKTSLNCSIMLSLGECQRLFVMEQKKI